MPPPARARLRYRCGDLECAPGHGTGGPHGRPVPIRWATTLDEQGIVTTQYLDPLGHTYKTRADSGGASAKNASTTFGYNALDQLLWSATPLKHVGSSPADSTSYWYDTLGRLTKTYQPDADTTAAKYDTRGNLRFSQDGRQQAAGLGSAQ